MYYILWFIKCSLYLLLWPFYCRNCGGLIRFLQWYSSVCTRCPFRSSSSFEHIDITTRWISMEIVWLSNDILTTGWHTNNGKKLIFLPGAYLLLTNKQLQHDTFVCLIDNILCLTGYSQYTLKSSW